MTYFKTVIQYLCVGTLFGLIGLMYSLLEGAGVAGLWLNIPVLALVVLVFLIAQKLYGESPRLVNSPEKKHVEASARTFPVLFFDEGEIPAPQKTLRVTAGSGKSEQLAQRAILEVFSAPLSAMRMRLEIKQLQIEIDAMKSTWPEATTLQQAYVHMLSGSYSQSTAVSVAPTVDILYRNLDTVILCEVKTRDKLIELQRKPLEESAKSTPRSRLLPNRLQYG